MKEYININLYEILCVNNNSDINEIKNSYRKLSKKYHPDVSKETDAAFIFSEISKAYGILSNNELRDDYDLKSKFGKNYDETYELFNLNIDYSYNDAKDQLENFKKYQVNNIQIKVDDYFDGSLEYQRWVRCKKCDGSGRDINQKIIIKDNQGNILRTFDGEDGCDYCEGTGVDYRGKECYFCKGNGKVGLNNCNTCNGDKRILGKQKIKNVKLTGETTKMDSMGHYSPDGSIGYLLIKKNNENKTNN